MKLTSSAFAEGAMIPSEFTCDGQDRVPPLMIEGAPSGTVSFALIMHDPDSPSGNWDHWIAFDIPASTTSIDSQVGTQGMNSWPKLGYGGPCPGTGNHRYVFDVYALDANLGLPSGSTRSQVETAMKGHVLDQAQLIGTYIKVKNR